jgi:hypothetical protein
MGVGVAAVVKYVRDRLADSNFRRPAVYAASLLALLPIVSLASNYHECDRSANFLPYQYAKNILDGVEENAILFTAGDNDTFPVWCLQEAYNYRKDVVVANLSLLNTDWYVEQMKNRYGVPISLTEDQILWHPYEIQGHMTNRPLKPFRDRPRGRMTYMHPQFSGVATQDLMVDEIVIENRWRQPIYFSGPPYADSPLRLREHAVHDGQLYRLEREPPENLCDVEHGYQLFMNVYKFDGLEDAEVYRDDNATGVYAGLGMASLRIFDELLRQVDRERAVALMERLTEVYPEFWQSYISLADLYLSEGDSAAAIAQFQRLNDVLTGYVEIDPHNQYYVQDLGTAKLELGLLQGDEALVEEGLDLVREGFEINKNAGLAYMKALTAFQRAGRTAEIMEVTRLHAEYKRNLQDPRVQQILGLTGYQP